MPKIQTSYSKCSRPSYTLKPSSGQSHLKTKPHRRGAEAQGKRGEKQQSAGQTLKFPDHFDFLCEASVVDFEVKCSRHEALVRQTFHSDSSGAVQTGLFCAKNTSVSANCVDWGGAGTDTRSPVIGPNCPLANNAVSCPAVAELDRVVRQALYERTVGQYFSCWIVRDDISRF